MSYGYVPHYVTEEQEMSESDCPSDTNLVQHVTADVTELYRRKHQTINHARNIGGSYYHTHMPGYYEQHSRLPTTCTCNFPQDPRYCYYKPVPQNQEGMLRSSTHIASNLRTCPETKAGVAIKKYPVTARTPKYYRSVPAQLCKRPSALCLPVTCQPDPAASNRPRKAPPEIQHYRGQEAAYAINDYVMRTTAVKRTTDGRPMDSEGDVNSRLNDLENLLTKFGDEGEEGENEQVEIATVSDLSKILKPKVPSSVRAKQDQVLKLRAVKTNVTETISSRDNVKKLDVQEVPEEPIDVILKRLNQSNLKQSDEKRSDNTMNQETLPKPDVINRQRHTIYMDQKPPLDDTSALELHKSKSYIVSLIDKALSKELGTIPGDKCTRKEFLNMNPKKAMDLVNRHSFPKDYEKVTGFDVAQASTSKKEDKCTCKNEEPMYLKQLKQLRWSHLRHIQREAKRLADLERFLDSFSEELSPP